MGQTPGHRACKGNVRLTPVKKKLSGETTHFTIELYTFCFAKRFGEFLVYGIY